jgi:gamma-glutamyltranspeptidase/glutathione hydrolase
LNRAGHRPRRLSALAPAVALAALAAALALPPRTAAPASPPAPRGTGGAVVSGDAYATEAGLETLAAGGNAVDAAVATALALAVTFPEAGNLGGGGFALVRLPAEGGGWELASLDFREAAPAAATRTMYLDDAGEPVPDASLIGPLAAGVPGSPAGFHALHARHGRLPWPRVVEPARRLAASGFVVGPHLHRVLSGARDRLSRFPETAAVWLPEEGAPPPVGTRIALPALAATLAAYAGSGPEAIVAGPPAAAVEAASRRHGGVLTAADLAAYEPAWREPVVVDAYGWRVAGMGLPSSGGIVTGQTLGMLDRRGWAELPRGGAGRAHLLAEAWRRAYADRYLLGDPATTGATAAELLDPAWLDARAASIDPARATTSRTVGDRASARTAAAGAEGTETTHLSAADAAGGIVALTTTLNDLFGCALWVDEIGFLNDEMDDFATAPGRPNLYGLIQGEANEVAPGKRMLSSMSPTIAWNDGPGERSGEVVALGGRGGSRIPTNAVQVLLHLIVDGEPLQAALDRPRLHHQWFPDRLDAEPGALAPETAAVLERLGHEVRVAGDAAKIHAVRRLPDGSFEAAADPRGPGAAAVLEPAPSACCGLGGAEPQREPRVQSLPGARP